MGTDRVRRLTDRRNVFTVLTFGVGMILVAFAIGPISGVAPVGAWVALLVLGAGEVLIALRLRAMGRRPVPIARQTPELTDAQANAIERLKQMRGMSRGMGIFGALIIVCEIAATAAGSSQAENVWIFATGPALFFAILGFAQARAANRGIQKVISLPPKEPKISR